jgi:predicted nucleic acid-binding protein
MTMKTFAFDTSMIVRLMRGALALSSVVQSQHRYILPVTALGELLVGVLKSPDPVNKLVQVQAFVSPFHLISIDARVAGEYARVKARVRICGMAHPRERYVDCRRCDLGECDTSDL